MKYQVCEPLTNSEYADLKASIAEHGVLVPVEVDEQGNILDGHHRVRAWQELRDEGLDLPKYARLVRGGMSEEAKFDHALRLNDIRRHMSKEARERTRQRVEEQRERVRQQVIELRQHGNSYRQIADEVGISHVRVREIAIESGVNQNDELTPTVVVGADGKTYPAQQAPKPAPPISLFVPGNEALDADAAEATVKEIRQERREEIRHERVEKIVEIAKGNAPLKTPVRYPVVYADPPWRYEHSKTVSREIENQYPTMTIDEICALPVSDIATPDAVLFLWTTSPKLAESMQVIESWGFVYRTCMVWDKERIGMGYYARQQHELLLIATRGDLPVPEPANRPNSVVRIRRDPEHSAKPQEFYHMIESMYPEYDKIELFARNTRAGWAAWGNQAE